MAFDLPREKRSPAQRRKLVELMIAGDPTFNAEMAALAKRLRAAEPKFVTTMIVRERTGESPRRRSSMMGGDFTRKGDRVQPGVPAVIAAALHDRVRARRSIAWTSLAGWSIAATP